MSHTKRTTGVSPRKHLEEKASPPHPLRWRGLRKSFHGLAPTPNLAHGRSQVLGSSGVQARWQSWAERAKEPTTAAGLAGLTPRLCSLWGWLLPGTGPAII